MLQIKNEMFYFNLNTMLFLTFLCIVTYFSNSYAKKLKNRVKNTVFIIEKANYLLFYASIFS